MENEERINKLDQIRGLAILMVVVYHTTDFAFAGSLGQAFLFLRSGLWTGVDLFFVLSGFLITKRLLEQRDQQRFLRHYFVRRLLRIFPLFYAYLIAILIVLPLAALISGSALLENAVHSEPFKKLSEGQFWLWTYTHNFYQANGPGMLPGMGHLWSLAVEEQFYLVWPFLVLVFRSQRVFACVSAMVLVIACVTRVVLTAYGFEEWAIFHITPARLDGLAAGAIVASLHSKRSLVANVRVAWPVGLVAILAIAILMFRNQGFDKLNREVQLFGYLAVSCFFATVVSSCATSTQEKKGSSALRFLERVGRISYCIYVVHWPIQIAVSAVLAKMQWPIAMAATVQFTSVFLLSYLLAALSWKYFELPLIRLGRRITSI